MMVAQCTGGSEGAQIDTFQIPNVDIYAYFII